MSNSFKLQAGDIFLLDSNSTESKIVKFLMSSDTIWHWIVGKLYEFITGKYAPHWLIRPQYYYHVGLIYSDSETIEQQGKVLKMPISRLDGKSYMIIRKIGLTDAQLNTLLATATNDLGNGYDILLIIGKSLHWLTGIPFFTLLLNLPKKELCVTITAKWIYKTWGELWGRKNYNFVQTDDMYYYAINHPSEYITEKIL